MRKGRRFGSHKKLYLLDRTGTHKKELKKIGEYGKKRGAIVGYRIVKKKGNKYDFYVR